jgi:hypothetical protein
MSFLTSLWRYFTTTSSPPLPPAPPVALSLTVAEHHAGLAARVARMKSCLARQWVPYTSLQSEAYYELEASTAILALELAILDSQASLEAEAERKKGT